MDKATIKDRPTIIIKGCNNAKQRVNALYAAERFIEQFKLNGGDPTKTMMIPYGRLLYGCVLKRNGNVTVFISGSVKNV